MKFGIKTKKILTKTVFVLLSAINKMVRHNPKKVLFYINTDFRENNKFLYDYMLKYGYNDSYRIICHSSDYIKYKKNSNPNVSFVGVVGCILHFFTAGKVFYCIGHLPIDASSDQKILQMWHGTPLKDVDKGSLLTHPVGHKFYTKVLAPSQHFIPMYERFFNVDKSKVVIGGMPRNETLYEPSPQYDFGEYKKLIVWAPTFRKSSQLQYTDSNLSSESLIPILKKTDLIDFDIFLKTLGVKIIVKLHPFQDLSGWDEYNKLDSLILLSHQEFTKRDMDLYKLLKQSNALITDYSSIYFDYLLLNRPIGFTEDDLKSYEENRGFVMSNPDDYKPGFRIRTKSELIQFCCAIVSEQDDYVEERIRVNNLANDYRDGNFCKRILDIMDIKR